ncbi:MAG TPA: translation initiation factor IF-2 [Candidatus Elarobacter sp.]|nr:translation initiation factor IF-2 [Candidatus Elarobacter sp.]
MKIRINDLARELEVKSKAILDVMDAVGVTEKKTHSSSIEEDEAERVRKHFSARSSSSSRERTSATEVKPKIDLSKISKPGDVMKLLRQREQDQQHPPAPPARQPAATATPIAPPTPVKAATPMAAPPAAEKPTVVIPQPAAPAAERSVVVTSPLVKQVAPVVVVVPPPFEKSTAPPAVVVIPPVHPPAAVVAPPPAAQPKAPIATAGPQATPPAPSSRPVPGQPIVQQRRMITPQTGPRPVYTAPPPRVAPPSVPQGRPMQGAPGTRPMQGQGSPGQRPQGVVRGQPIFQRPRPSGPGGPGGTGGPPGSRPQYQSRPGEQRRGPHPTSSPRPGGYPPRPGMGGGVGPGGPPPPAGRPARPGGPARRPGQPYIPREKEGTMKGFVPPPRLALSNEPLPITRSITIGEGISVKDLAEKLGVRAKDLIARLLMKGVMATVNQSLDFELAKDLARHFGAESESISFEDQAAQEMATLTGVTEEKAALAAVTRPPVVTIMGHVDHGKTSLLDAIRETDVAGGEAGGITQHIGAYKVKITKEDSPAFGRQIVFLDTPGHEAFTRMRARGAKVTDIVVLVVAADDGVMPQTLEAMDHAKAAKVPIIVAVNKIDKPEALPDRVKKQLADRGLMPEDWGGTTVFVDVSAKKRTNLNLLMEMICLVADLQDLKANPERPATGTVVEAKIDRGRGVVATVLVQNGTLRVGDNFIIGNTFGKVRAMFDDRSKAVEEAPPSTPVEVIGLEGLPQSGDVLMVADREKARQIAEYREQRAREATLLKSSKLSLEGLAEQIKTAGMKELPIILKADVQGSSEVLADTLTRLSNEKVKIKILHTGVGAINENDVLLASASNAVIIGFNVRPERKAQELAEQEKIDIRLHSIIYELQDQIKKAMLGLLDPVIKETYMGRAEVRDTFRVPKAGTIAGCYVLDGLIKRDSDVRLMRDGVQVYKGKVGSLRRFKDDASEVRNGMECGINLQNFNDVKKGDVIEAFVTERIAAEMGVA